MVKKTMRNDNAGKLVMIFLIVLFCFVNPNAYAEYLFPTGGSNFVIKDISEEAEHDLELVKYHINYVDDEYYNSDYPLDGYFQEYTLYNNGDVPYKVRLGVMCQYTDEIPNDLFKINDVPVRHQMGRLTSLNQYGEIELNFPYAFIDVVFPPQERTKIRVNDFSYTWKYNNITNTWDRFAFRGTPRFTATIGNYLVDIYDRDLGIEQVWINDILFFRMDSMSDFILYDSILSMIAEEGSLSNRLFDIRKKNENAWEIEFTAEFVDRYRNNLSFSIDGLTWGRRRSINRFDRPELFDSEEKISPYRYIFLTNKQLQVVRNAYYARHGYIFRNSALRRMYESYDLGFGNINYKPNPNFHEGMLTDIDWANIETIRRLEALTAE
jgi:hypothetical protein